MLVTNGCSFVWGDELEGFEDSPPTHWKHTFTYKLAEKLNIPYENLARCGNGNDKIYRDTVDYLISHDKPEYLFISWSAPKRIELFEPKPEGEEEQLKIYRDISMSQFSPERVQYLNKQNRDIAQLWTNLVYNHETGLLHLLTYMKSIQLLCDAMGIKCLQTVFHYRVANTLREIVGRNECQNFTDYIENSLNELREESTLGYKLIPFSDSWIDMYEMGNVLGKKDEKYAGCHIKEFGHPCEQTNTVYADQIFNKMKDLGWVK